MADVTIRAEFAAVVLVIPIAVGDSVTAGQELLVLESMKTEIPVLAPASGRVTAVRVVLGQAVDEREPLVVLET